MRLSLLILLTCLAASRPCLQAREHLAALVIGNGAYITNPVPNAAPDITAVSRTLQNADFTLVAADRPGFSQDLTRIEMEQAFSAALNHTDVDLLLIYYVGHAAQVDGTEYMVPVDAELHEPADLKKAAVSLDSWLDQINRLKFKRAVIIIDGSPVHFPGEVTEGARVPGGNNIFVALSTSQGRPSANGKTGEHSPLAMAFLEALVAPSQSVVGMFNDIRTRVWDGLPQRWEPKLWGNPEAWQSISLLATPASPPMQHEPEETPLALSHDFDVSEFPYTPKQGTVRPAATLNHAIRWTKWWDGHPPPGWHQIELTGWLVVRGKDGYAYAVDGNGFWNVSNQRKENGSATTALNLHATAALDAENIIATVSEGTGVWELGRLMIDGREWLRCQWTCHINDGTAAPFDPYRPGEPYEADLTFPSSDHAPTISHRVFRFRSSAEPLEMSFTNHRDCAGPDKHGRALLEGTWTGMTFISHSQKMLDGYKNWINETIVVHLNDAAYAGAGSVSVEFPRKGATVRVEAYLHGNAEKARKGKGP